MVQAAIAAVEGFYLDGRELRREGPSYTIDTLVELREELDNARLCLLVGMDAFVTFPTWHQWRALFDYAHVVVMGRPGAAQSVGGELAAIIREREVHGVDRLAQGSAGSILFHSVTQLDVSASRIRQMTAEGKSARFLTPEPVLEIITREALYR